MSELIELFCECGQQAPCEERVNVTAATYERVRADPTTFILLPGTRNRDRRGRDRAG